MFKKRSFQLLITTAIVIMAAFAIRGAVAKTNIILQGKQQWAPRQCVRAYSHVTPFTQNL